MKIKTVRQNARATHRRVSLVLAAVFAAGTLRAALSVSNTSSLAFGGIIPGSSSGQVTISPAGGRTVAGGCYGGNDAGSAASSFTVTGPASAAYSVILPSSETIFDGSKSMTLSAFTTDATGSAALDAAGHGGFHVGAALQVGAHQPTGHYSGTFVVIVSAN